MSDLKPCAHCGGEAKFSDDDEYFWVECDNCWVKTEPVEIGSVHYKCIESTWNKRAQPTIAEYLAHNEDMHNKTGCKMVSIESLKEFKG